MAKKKQELEFIFINPNTEEQTEKMITYYYVTAGMKRMKEALAELETKELNDLSPSEPKQNKKDD